MNIIWRRQAQVDVRAAYRYILDYDPDAALRIVEMIEQRVLLLATHPGLGRPGRHPGTRELVVTPYIVAYTVDERQGAIFILRVLHGTRRWPKDLSE